MKICSLTVTIGARVTIWHYVSPAHAERDRRTWRRAGFHATYHRYG